MSADLASQMAEARARAEEDREPPNGEPPLLPGIMTTENGNGNLKEADADGMPHDIKDEWASPPLRSSLASSVFSVRSEAASVHSKSLGRAAEDAEYRRFVFHLAEYLGGVKQRLCDTAIAELDHVCRELLASTDQQQGICQAFCQLGNKTPAHPAGVPRSSYVPPSTSALMTAYGKPSKAFGKSTRESQLDPFAHLGMPSVPVLQKPHLAVRFSTGDAAIEALDEEDEALDDEEQELGRTTLFGEETVNPVDAPQFELFPYWINPNGSSESDEHSLDSIEEYKEIKELQWSVSRNSSPQRVGEPDGGDVDYAFHRSDSRIARFVMSPFNTYKVVWDLCGVALIAYDTISIPLQFFELDDVWFTIMMAWIAMVFWLMDMVLTFFTGICDYSTSKVEMRPSKIAAAYLKSWFLLDLLVVLPDWVILFMASSSDGVTRLGKAARALRALRALRLLRLAKIRKMFHTLQSRMNNEYLVCYLQLAKLMISIAVVTHIAACSWYGMSMSEEEDRGWVKRFKYDEGNDKAYQYLTSLHWALCVFQGAMEVFPGTRSERAFAVVVQFVGLIIVSYFISSITHFMTEIRVIHTNKLQRRSHLIRYLCQMSISPELSVRIKQFADKVARTERTSEDEVEILAYLPEDMKRDLNLELKGPALAVHPMINNLVWNNKRLASQFVDHVSQVSMHYGEVLFKRGDESIRLYVAMHGVLVYDKDPFRKLGMSGSLLNDFTRQPTAKRFFRPTQVKQNEWLCEIAIWTNWVHRGSLTARAHCEVFGIVRERLAEIVASLNSDAADLVFRHARLFVNWANDQVYKTIDDLSHMPYGQKAKKGNIGRETGFFGSGHRGSTAAW